MCKIKTLKLVFSLRPLIFSVILNERLEYLPGFANCFGFGEYVENFNMSFYSYCFGLYQQYYEYLSDGATTY